MLISLKSSLIRSIPRLVALPSPPLQTLAHLPRPGGARSRDPRSEINRQRARSLTPLRSPCMFTNTDGSHNMDVLPRSNAKPACRSAAERRSSGGVFCCWEKEYFNEGKQQNTHEGRTLLFDTCVSVCVRGVPPDF